MSSSRPRARNTVSISVDGLRAPAWRERLRRFCLAALGEMGARGWEVSVLLCDDRAMRRLNARYRQEHAATDVLAFPQREGPRGGDPRMAGDVVISLDRLRRNSIAFGVSEAEELGRLAVHGLLHLAGMDHGGRHGDAMLLRQELLLQRLAPTRVLARRRR